MFALLVRTDGDGVNASDEEIKDDFYEWDNAGST